jgi:hypothetical protein
VKPVSPKRTRALHGRLTWSVSTAVEHWQWIVGVLLLVYVAGGTGMKGMSL